MSETKPIIEMNNLSRWYGEVLGINRVTATIKPGITGLLGPNGAGKSTLMNLICGLLRPSQGTVRVFGERIWNNPTPLRRLGYCTQYDNFYEDLSAFEFLYSLVSLRGYDKMTTRRLAIQALERVNLQDAMHKRLASFSKGMRQRVKAALALADNPDVLVLDEPLNGLDALGRYEMIDLIKSYGKEGRNVLISSHILHEIETMTDNILMLSNGYLLAEGNVREVRGLLKQHPHEIYLRCDDPRRFAYLLFSQDGILSVEIEPDGESLMARTYDLDSFYQNLNTIVLEHGIHVSLATIADENIQAVFKYLSGNNHG
ncbi:ABC transporter ATP-binding protein [Candidatus Sumerlaeota bacterium]|nr:ABC transporter ATP-binding protein [Candidatus Sumerlaeota bacterium]